VSSLRTFGAFIPSKIRANRRYRETVRDLMQFSDRELDDLGISRDEIDVIARQNVASSTTS
jgi:uncharacterized protein YjiS (DUF1127 family)